MRSIYLPLLALVLTGLTMMRPAFAGAWIERIDGKVESVTVERGGMPVEIREMMRLRQGDHIKVSGTDTSVRVLLGTGTIKRVDQGQSPFVLPQAEKESSFLVNLIGEVKKMLVVGEDETQAVAMVTRGRNKGAVNLLATGDDENLIPVGFEKLHIAWRGGKTPFSVAFMPAENDKPLYSRAKLTQRQYTLATGLLKAEDYRLVVTDAGGKPEESKELEITFANHEQLPDNARKLLDLKLDKRVEARLLINILYKMPEWRLFAHSLAMEHGLEDEKRLLERTS